MGAALTVQQMLRRMLYIQGEGPAASYSTVLLDELHAVLARRRWLGLGRVAADPKPYHLDQLVPEPSEEDPSARREPKLEDVLVEARKARLVALCLSGGGIRSASFNLGVLQRLAGYGLLRHIDYLSTVSGGGYIGSWLTSLLQREVRRDVAAAAKTPVADASTAADEHPESRSTRSREAFRDFEDRLGWSADDQRSQESRNVGEHPAISELRGLSNFLTPKLGVFSADTWALFGTYVRNATLNQLVLVLFLGTLLLIPRLLAGFLGEPSSRLTTALAVISAALFVFGAFRFGPSFVRAGYSQDAKDDKRSLDTFGVFSRVVGPVVIIGVISAAIPDIFAMSRYPLSYVWGGSAAAGVLLSVLFWLIAWFAARLHLGKKYRLVATRRRWMVVAVLISGAVFGLMCCFTLLRGIAGVDYVGYRLMLGPPAFIASILVASIVHIGLAGSAITAGSREWLSRFGGLLALAGLAWFVVTGMVFFSALAVNALGLLSIPAIGAWIASTASGAYLGRTSNGAGRVRGWVLAIAPWLFILGLLILLSAGVQGLLHSITASWVDSEVGTAFTTYADALGWRDFDSSAVLQRYGTWLGETERWYVILPLMIAAVLLCWLFAKRVDINTFSLHNMYGHRLVRCFLGAANRSLDRSDRGDPFTKLSPDDDLGLAATWTDTDTVMGLCAPGDQVATLPRPIPAYPGPYQIVNTAINLSGSDNLAWQERKAGPFIMTPLYCGFTLAGTRAEGDDPDANDAYRPTGQFASSPRGLTLGEAVATSGAAASPNMGYHTTSALAFLLGVFNVRLGRWVANPRQLSRANTGRFQDWHHSGPSFALWYLLREVFGTTDKNNEFVYLSDGGHFENLGIYEAVRRRCRYVIACDSGADPDYAFEDLGNAIRKCRIDLNVEIDIDVREIATIDERRCNGAPCAVGTIRYPEEGNTGTLLYIKSCRRPGAPTDVVQYAGKSAAFPHESTADQWFSESQFESYRKHGYFLASEVLATAMDELRGATRRECEKKDNDSGSAACVGDNNGNDKRKDGKKEDFRNAFRMERLFRRLQQEWHPASPAVSANFTRLAEQVDAAFTTLRKSPDLEFLNEQFYPEWRTLLDGKDGEPVRHSPTIWSLPEDPDLLRRGFYFCNSLIQLMESVYLDLGLETEWDHPDNSGWMNVFRHWTWSSMFRVTWAISAATYGRRFRAFCRHRLSLQLGEVHARQVHTGKLSADDVDKVLTPKLLNVVERQQIRKLVSGSLSGRKIEVYRLDLEVEQIGEPSKQPSKQPSNQPQDQSGDQSGDQLDKQADNQPENPPLRCFSVGYGVTTDEIKDRDIDSDEIESRDDEIDGLLMMFRVQDHLRNMELGRRGLEHLVEVYGEADRGAYGPTRKLGLPSRREALLHEIDEVVDPQHVAEFRAMFENVLTEKKI